MVFYLYPVQAFGLPQGGMAGQTKGSISRANVQYKD